MGKRRELRVPAELSKRKPVQIEIEFQDVDSGLP
jgi:hypothetical protein